MKVGPAEVDGEVAVQQVDALRRPRTAKFVRRPLDQRAEDDRRPVPLEDVGEQPMQIRFVGRQAPDFRPAAVGGSFNDRICVDAHRQKSFLSF
ncbi:MAG: hypothetical protein HC829_05525 [Bacteroidales bacterium]|nr:hypothetical protein [Bacteroidales bacterium]